MMAAKRGRRRALSGLMGFGVRGMFGRIETGEVPRRPPSPVPCWVRVYLGTPKAETDVRRDCR